ncbi:MAG TPA: universal stress protein [Candidatus Obscuribacterales bacterium]
MNRVLVAIEDETFGQAIVDFVGQLKWPSGAKFKLIHVIEPQPIVDAPPSYWQEALEQSIARGQKLLDGLAAKLRAQISGADVVQEVVEGFAKETILEMAEDWKVDLIIMGSHGRKGFSRFLLGSVSSAVSENAGCSTLIVRLPQAKDKTRSQAEQKSLTK